MYNHYFKDVPHLDKIDVYRVLDLFGVTHPALAHAAKKILVAGGRGAKDADKDIKEAIDALQRWQEMRREDGTKLHPLGDGGETVSMLDKLTLNCGGISGTWHRADLPEATAQSYADESGYTQQDLQAASLVHDATPLDPELVELCSNTEIHANGGRWIKHHGQDKPIVENTLVEIKLDDGFITTQFADNVNWSHRVEYWRYAVPRKD